VTNNQDEDGMGRVKVQLPMLSDDNESYWARIAVPMSGKSMGVYFLPEVGDEVLIAFEHGLVEIPYVIGSLWNGKASPPESNDDGKNNRRVIKSRSGHLVAFDDSDGAEKIEVIDKSGNNKIIIDTSNNAINIAAEGDITIKAGGKLQIEGTGGVTIKSGADLAVNASSGKVDVEGGPQMNLKAQIININ
jgi:uncharacterized protein involved in type VI secretion and phage assembly